MKMKETHLFSGIVLLWILLPGQSAKLFGFSSGIIYKALYFSPYLAITFLFFYAITIKQKEFILQVKRLLSMFLSLIILMIAVEIFAAFLSPIPPMYGLRYWTRSLYTFLYRISTYIGVITVVLLCKDKAIDVLSNVFLFDEFLLFISGFFRVGISGVIQSIVGAVTFNGFTDNYFEVHELTFAIGLCIIYYLFFCKNRKNIGKLVLLIFCFILGAKRIGIAGIIAAGIFALVVHKKGLTRRKLVFTGIAGVVICLCYLLIVYNNEFFAILNEHAINNMGRDIIYQYFTRRTSFSPSQIPWGIAGVTKVIENMDRNEVMYMASVRGLHNDILKIYINYGFWGSLIWYIINLVYLPVKFLKEYGKRSATIYMSLILYMFITYLTDNTDGYFMCQVTLYLIPLCAYWIDKKKN